MIKIVQHQMIDDSMFCNEISLINVEPSGVSGALLGTSKTDDEEKNALRHLSVSYHVLFSSSKEVLFQSFYSLFQSTYFFIHHRLAFLNIFLFIRSDYYEGEISNRWGSSIESCWKSSSSEENLIVT